MRHRLPTAAAVVAGLTLHSAAQAQSSVDQAHATINRLLNGAGDVLVFTTGRTLESAHARISSPRTVSRCSTGYNSKNPDSPDLPESYRNKVSSGGELDWRKVTASRVSGARFYYDHVREATGKQFTYHFQLESPEAAADFGQAARALIEACRSGDQDEQAVEEAVHDPRGNTASLAIDRRNGARYGWAVDYKNLTGSDARALTECKRGARGCQVVLRFTGGCGAYAADQAKGSSVYGWGTAPTRAGAEERAWSEARKRGATNLVTRVWGCNSVKASGGVNAAAIGSQSGPPRISTGLSDEVIRRNAEALKAHAQTVDQYKDQLKANREKVGDAVAERRAVQEAHERELAKARAARAQYERERQAYREEYKRVTGRYPDE